MDSAADGNSVIAQVPAGSGLLAGAVNGGLHVGGDATVADPDQPQQPRLRSARAEPQTSAGAGIGNLSGRLTLDKSAVIGNSAAATGVGGLVVGGGILNIAFGGSVPQLALTDSVVTANRLVASGPGFDPQGGGIFSKDPSDRRSSRALDSNRDRGKQAGSVRRRLSLLRKGLPMFARRLLLAASVGALLLGALAAPAAFADNPQPTSSASPGRSPTPTLRHRRRGGLDSSFHGTLPPRRTRPGSSSGSRWAGRGRVHEFGDGTEGDAAEARGDAALVVRADGDPATPPLSVTLDTGLRQQLVTPGAGGLQTRGAG